MTFESEGLLIVAIYIWLPPASYVVFSDNSGLSFAVRIYLENFEKEIFLLNIYTRNELHVYVFALPFK